MTIPIGLRLGNVFIQDAVTGIRTQWYSLC
jgi:hypothetical protein